MAHRHPRVTPDPEVEVRPLCDRLAGDRDGRDAPLIAVKLLKHLLLERAALVQWE